LPPYDDEGADALPHGRRDKSEYIIQAVSHALDLLEQFRGEDAELGVTELSRRLRLSKNNAFRLLATLEARGYVEKNKATDAYRLGLKSLQLGRTFIRQIDLQGRAQPILEKIVRSCQETAYLAMFQEASVVYLGVVETEQPVRVVSRIGARLPLYCTASGKLRLASLSAEERQRLLEQGERKPLTPQTITDLEQLQGELESIARAGFAVDHEECEPGVRCVAAPVRDFTGRVIGALVISGPNVRLPDDRVDAELAPLVLQSAAELSARLGYSAGA
jgi:DNA-binding IclR family transcriptional regulator